MKQTRLWIVLNILAAFQTPAFAADQPAADAKEEEHICEKTIRVVSFNAIDHEYYNEAAQQWHTATAMAADREGNHYVFYIDMYHNPRNDLLIPLQHSIAEKKYTTLKIKTSGNCDFVYLITQNEVVSTELTELLDASHSGN